MGIARRSIESVGWNAGASLFSSAILFARAIFLARWLEVETFGSYVWAGSLVSLTVILVGFGMGAAFVNRVPETEDEDLAATVHFTLKVIFVLIWIVGLATYTVFFTSGDTQVALLVLIGTNSIIQLCQTPQLLLTRRVTHQRIAINQLAIAILTTVSALILAWNGQELWALLSTDIVVAVLTVSVFYVWRPVWRLRLGWNSQVGRYFLQMGGRTLPSTVLLLALDRVDDLWTGRFLGKTALGYYSRAYTFATYPRIILSQPINNVATGTYAELKEQKRRLSQAFFRSNAVLIRAGFMFAGGLALMAPELILLLLGEKWLPMLTIFRLMLIYTLLDPVKLTVANLFLAVGDPGAVVRTRLIQLGVMLLGLFTLGFWYETVGVALAVDFMLVVGMLILFGFARKYVDYSLRVLFLVPSLALVAGLLVTWAIATYGMIGVTPWVVLFSKGTIFTITYLLILLLEKRNVQMIRELIAHYRSRGAGGDS